MWAAIKRFFAIVAPDPYHSIANVMELEGYTDFEIDIEIAAMKAADARKLDPSADDPMA